MKKQGQKRFWVLLLTLICGFSYNGIAIAKKKKPFSKKRKQIAALGYRSIDGAGNNEINSSWGQAKIEQRRLFTNSYADGVSSIDESLPSARLVSNNIAAQDESIINDRGLTDMVWQWGQFLDHDIVLTHSGDEPANIPVPLGDSSFDPFATGQEEISFSRSEISDQTGTRQQVNSITAFIDASNVYGSDDERAAALRSFEGGKLKVSDGNLLPFNTEGLDNAGGPSSSLFLAGDIRANEQVGLIAMHTLFVREHNRLCEKYAAVNPQLGDEELYQKARKYVGALMQVITYKEFLPTLMGKHRMKPYHGYKADVNPGIFNSFAVAAYRFGHSTISPTILRLDNAGNEIEAGNLSIAGAFFRPDLLDSEESIGYLLKGLASQEMQEIDSKITDGLRNFLFGAPGSGGLDLASLNIQRGRDHGVGKYNQVRRELGLEAKTSFAEISSDQSLVLALEETYGDLEKIDLWVGMMAEDHMKGASFGQTMMRVLKKQFYALRNGDNYWYRRTFTGAELRKLERTRLSDVIKRNTQITNLQRNVFEI